MDTNKWKSILVPRDVYEEIRELSRKEGRDHKRSAPTGF